MLEKSVIAPIATFRARLHMAMLNASIGAGVLVSITLLPLLWSAQLSILVTKFLVLACMGLGILRSAERIGHLILRKFFALDQLRDISARTKVS